MRKLNKQTLFTAVLAMLAVAFSALFSFAVFPARAEEAPAASKEKAGLTRLLVDQNEYTSLHYFSDYSLAPSYFSSGGYIYSAMVNYAYSHNTFSIANSACYNLNNLYPNLVTGMYDSFTHYCYTQDYEDIEDAFIIFEVRTYLYWAASNDKVATPQATRVRTFLTQLSTVFSSWKNNGCKIMFICNTDEHLFVDEYNTAYTGFLNYVDIHINTDLFTDFYRTALEDITYDMEGSTILLDLNFGNGDVANGAYSGFINYIVSPYLQRIYSDIDLQTDYNGNLYELLQDKNINLLLYNETLTSGGITTYYFYNYTAQQPENYADGTTYHNDNANITNHLYALCSTINSNNVFPLWDFLSEIETADSTFISTYVYIENNAIPISVNVLTYESAGWTAAGIVQVISTTNYNTEFNVYGIIIEDFLDGYDLSQYDNWDGVCDITFKLMYYDPDAWLRAHSFGDNDLSGLWTFLTI